MQTNPNHKSLGIVTVSEEQLELMCENGDKLYHLEGGEVFLPPNEFLVFGTHGGDHVVEIHDNVYEAVE